MAIIFGSRTHPIDWSFSALWQQANDTEITLLNEMCNVEYHVMKSTVIMYEKSYHFVY